MTVAAWGTEIQNLLAGGALEFLPLRFIAYLLVGGMIVGSAGGFAAARHAA
jgi:hypothetical protein